MDKHLVRTATVVLMNGECRIQDRRRLSTRSTLIVGTLSALVLGCGNHSNPLGPSPGPSITAISPTSALAGTADLTLTVTGSNFLSGISVRTSVIWSANGTDTSLTTTFVNSSLLTAVVPAALLADVGTAQVLVETGNPSDGSNNPPRSNAVGFDVTSSATVVGDYRATLTASPWCASVLPEIPRERTYTATLSADGSIRWSGPTLHSPPGHQTISSWTLSGDVFAFSVDVDRDPDYYSVFLDGIWDDIGNGNFLNIAGKGKGRPHGTEINGTFSGKFAFSGPGPGFSEHSCVDADHRFTFVKQ